MEELSRHQMLPYPHNPCIYEIQYQWMLGSQSVVSLIDADVDGVNAYLPEGESVHFWSGEIYDSSADGPIRAASGNRMPQLWASGLWNASKGEAA
jgi:alpha-glucosidase (family GH31 glycosyl hydrolase)